MLLWYGGKRMTLTRWVVHCYSLVLDDDFVWTTDWVWSWADCKWR